MAGDGEHLQVALGDVFEAVQGVKKWTIYGHGLTSGLSNIMMAWNYGTFQQIQFLLQVRRSKVLKFH